MKPAKVYREINWELLVLFTGLVGFLEYCRVGVPLTVLTLFLGWLFLAVVPV